MAVNSTIMIEVDPKLFITCRLCLEEMGVYQIVPTVQQQIKYCFDINVEPFDGLPQLLCKQCKILLDEYSANKKKFIDKQESLILKLRVKKDNESLLQPIIDCVEKHFGIQNNYNESEEDVDSSSLKTPKIHKKRKNRLMSNSSTASAESIEIKKKARKQNKHSMKWKKKYHKKFVCNICSKLHKEKTKLMNHLLDDHSHITSKYQYIFDKSCSVKLTKYDDKLNSTGLNDTIMLDQEKILQFDIEKSLYHVLYISRKKESKTNLNEEVIESLKRGHSESSGDDFLIARKKGKINRVFSRSSNETVLIDGQVDKASEKYGIAGKEDKSKSIVSSSNIPESKPDECINIDDSSDSDTENNTFNNSKLTEAKIEYKTIENIISVCRNKYLRKLELSQTESNQPSKKETHSDSQLKHKVLSIGRKILKKGGNFTGTGLLRYMEHKNLDISWLPKFPMQSDPKENLVRIMTKIKFSNLEDANDDIGWQDVPEEHGHKPIFTEDSERADASDSAELTVNKPSTITIVPSTVISKTYAPATSSEVVNAIPSSMNSAVLYAVDPEMSSTKILNQSPVANPKQLPKKLNVNDSKSVLVTKSKIDKVNNKSIVIDLDDEQNNETNLLMPVITSTTSLAKVTKDKKILSTSDVKKAPEKTVPRIKVKPASELMKPQNIMQTNENQNGAWTTVTNNFENRTIPNVTVGKFLQGLMMPQIQNVQSIQFRPEQNPINPVPVQTQTPLASNTEYLILDTIELPNTKTDSPFKYFKDLLLLHNIYLLDPMFALTREYICLLKIKVQFKDAYKEKPVTLCLSLFYVQNSFCICIKDSNRIDINMTKISAVWQWEVFKVFQSDISNKILQNSQQASPEVHQNTKTFLCLLKSINCRH